MTFIFSAEKIRKNTKSENFSDEIEK